MHALAAETWRREYRRDAAGATVRIGNRWAYAEYDPARAADSVREGMSNMGAPMRLTVVRTVTTDSGCGCEFPGQRRLDGELGAEVYYTRAYTSYENGSVENCNRLVRRWYPRGTTSAA